MLSERVDLFEFGKEERKFLRKVCGILEESPSLNYPAVYAGSGGDVEHGILLGNHIIFVDSHMPDAVVAEIKERLRKISNFSYNQKTVNYENFEFPVWTFTFKILDENIKLEYWNVDATKVLPKKIGVYFIKVPLPKEMNVGYLCSESNLKNALSRVVKGGYFLERECSINPEKYGFIHVLSGELSGLSIHTAKGNLYKKIKK